MSEEFNNENIVYEFLGRIMGLSAYELAVRNGYGGTEAEWLQSLIGKTAFEVAQQNGFEGTQAEWLASLVGKNAYDVAVIEGFEGTKAQWLESLKCKVLNITKTTSGNTNTYTMTFSNGNTQTFTVENGKEISSITKTASTATESTLLVTYNDGTTETVTIPNGTGISSVEKISTNVLEDTYRINYTDKEPTTFTVKNGRSIVSIAKSGSDGIVDTYTIHYNDNTTSTFTVVNSIDTVPYQYTAADKYENVVYSAGRKDSQGNIPVGTVAPAAGTQAEKYKFRWADSSTFDCYLIPARAGQMFRITATASSYNPLLTVVGANNIMTEINFGDSSYKLSNYLVECNEDGYLLINAKKDSTTLIKRVTIFTETEAAIAAIPSKSELVSAVIDALPLAEGGSF